MMVGRSRVNEDRTYYAELSPAPEIGWMIVMHISRAQAHRQAEARAGRHRLARSKNNRKRHERLLECCANDQRLDAREHNFANMIAASIEHMRHLIDDVL